MDWSLQRDPLQDSTVDHHRDNRKMLRSYEELSVRSPKQISIFKLIPNRPLNCKKRKLRHGNKKSFSCFRAGYRVRDQFYSLYEACFDDNLLTTLYVKHHVSPTNKFIQSGSRPNFIGRYDSRPQLIVSGVKYV